MKKKAKPKIKTYSSTKEVRSPKFDPELESPSRRPLRILAPPDIPGGRIAAIPFEAVVKKCVKTYEQNTGAKANQTRLIDFVRWCEENHGLL